MHDNVLPHIIRGVKEGLSANAIGAQLKAQGIGIRRADYLDLVRQVRAQLKTQATAMDRPGDRRPYRNELLFMSAATATGYMQMTDIWVRHVESGEVYSRPYGIRTDDLMTHNDAIATALDAFQSHAPSYGEIVLGASYLATYELVPGTYV